MPLTKKLAELHGGIFVIESILDQGTLMRVVLLTDRVIGREPQTEATV